MNISVTAGQLPTGFCPSTLQDMLNNFSAAQSVNLPSGLGQIVAQATAPSSSGGIVWLKLDSLGRPIGTYFFAQGAWLRLHPSVSGTTIWWFNALPDFTIFDGADGNVISAISGPMWQQALDINGNLISAAFPIAQGTLPSGTVLAEGINGGEELHTLVPGEDVPHQHFTANSNQTQNPLNTGTLFTNYYASNGTNPLNYQLEGDATLPPTLGVTSVTGGVTPPPQSNGQTNGIVTPVNYTAQYQAKAHQNMPPYVVGYLLQRTGRQFYVG